MGAGIGAALLLVLPHTLSTALAGQWPLLQLPIAVATTLPRLLLQLLPLLCGLFALALAQRQRGVPAAVRMQQLRARVPRAVPPSNVLLPSRVWRGPAILSPNELSGLWHLPTPALGQLVRWLPCRHLPAPPHAFVNDEPNRLIVGTAQHRDGTEAPVGLTFADGRQGIAFTAPPGVGKTQLASNLCDQFRALGYMLLDGKGDDSGNLVETMRARISRADEDRLILLDVLDADWPIGLNPLAGADRASPIGIDRVLGQVESIFARLDPETWGKAPRMKQFLRMATLLVVQSEPHPTLAHVKQALVDDGYRAQLLRTTTNVEVTTFWEITYPQVGESQRTSRDALLSRFDILLVPETTRYLFNQAAPTFTFTEAIAQRRIVFCPIPHRSLGGLAAPIGMLLFQAFMLAAFARPGADRERTEYGLICDEFQVLVENSDTKDVRDALTQVRSFGIVTVIANQLLTQLGDLAAYALTAITNRIVLHTQEPDASTYAAHYQASGLTAMDISGQEPREHQYARIMCCGVPAGPFSIRPLPWQPPIPADVPPDDGPAWQTTLPPNSPTPVFDEAILALAYDVHTDIHRVAQALADSTDTQWAALLARWDAIRIAQRQHILAHPGCISDRLERQVWLSRLSAARPRVLAMAEYARIRHTLSPEAILAERTGLRAPLRGAAAPSTRHSSAVDSPAPSTNFAEADQQPAIPRYRPDFGEREFSDDDDETFARP